MKIHLKRIFIILLAVTFVFQTAAFSASSGIRVFADTEEQITGLLETEENESSTLSEKDHPDGDVLREENGETIEMNTPETDTEEVSAEDARTEEETAEEVYEETSEAAEEPGIFNGEVEKAAAEQPLRAAAGTSILAFTSDTHNKSGNVAANRLGSWLDKMEGIYGKKVDLMAFGGDMANASASQTDFWTLTQADMDQLTQRNITGVYTTGNHEYSPGNYSNGLNSTTRVYIENAEGFEGSNYRIYCLGSSAYAESSGGGSWWGGGGGWNEYTASQVSKLSEYLGGIDNSKVIIVITHYPLHYNPMRTITGASDVIDVLNTAAGTGKKIVYLWGHNHTDADRANGEQNYDKVFKPGDSISYSSGNSKEINFYYGAAGCMSDSEYGTGSGAVKGKGLILEINEENKLTFTYYNEGATDVTEGGSFTEKDPVPIQDAAIDEATEMGPDGQFTVVQPTIEVRNTLQLHYTTVPEDATVRSITWTSDDTSIATVDSTGKVKGVNPGTTTITATISDGITRGTVSASIDVEIVPRTSSDPMYVRTDTILPDKNYIIANKDTGEAYALLNNNGTVSTVTVEIDGDTVYTDNENIVFTTEGSGTTVTAVKNNGRYISAGNNSLTLATSAPANRTFAYSADNRLTCRSGNSTYYIYYTTYNNRYTASTSASGTSSRAVYLFEEITEQVAVTGVSINPKTATVEARKTVDLNAIVSPSNASNKTVTWRSSDTSVATVDANGRVRGVSEGTAVITASAGGFSDTCTVTVTQSTTTEQHYVIVCDGFALSTDRSPNKAQGGSSSYTYTGLSGVEYAAGDAAADNIRWIFEEADGGYYIRSLDGDYLNATYTSGNNMGQGDLKVDGTPDVWVLDSGYSLDSGTVESSHLKSTNASSSATSDKFLGYEESPANLFTVRSSGNDDEVTISEAEDPVAVTGVSLTPKTAEIEARNTVQLTATVTPSNATNKTVTWSSSNTSVAVVDGNGRVRGVSEGEAVITASVGGFSDSCTVTVTASTSSEPTYVITVGNVALSTVPSDEQMENAGSGSQRYYYTGLAGAPFDPDEAADDTIRWILEPAEGGYYIKSLSGDYLNATYTQNSTGGYSGVLKLDSTPDVWVLDGTLDSWEVDGSLLKSSNASANASSPKYLAYDTGTTSSPRNLFTVRSESSASETTLVEAEDPVAVTGVSVTPETATVKARETVQLKATVTPSDATVKTVTWTSSNTAIATVDENGKVKGVAEGEAVITASAGGFSDTCTVTVTAGDPITGYVIMIDGFALSTDRSPNQAQGGNSSYTYTGLAGVAYSAEEDPAENIRWILEETDGGYYIRSLDGRYLNGAYTSGSNSGQGNLKLDDTRDVWVLDGTLEDWMIDGSMIRSTNATASTPDRPKYLGYEEAPANLFTVRSEENADESTLVDPSVTIEERFVETDRFEAGKEYIIGVTKDSGSVYAIKNVTGTSTGNTGSITLEVTPASGSEAAYIVTDDKDVVWKYSGSNQYLIASTGSDHYLGYETNSYLPRTSSQGRAIIYSGGTLQISSGRYLTCTGGTFATTTNSGSGSDVRLFVKTIEIITHEHTYGDPVWSWSGNVTAKATRAAVSATATFTCTECGESITEEAAITTSEVSGRTLYTATVTGPDGKEYTDSKYAADDSHYTITLTADKTMASPGDEVTFTITLGPVDRFGTFQMEVIIPNGLTYKAKSFEKTANLEETLGFDQIDWTESSMFFNGYASLADYSSTEDTILATFKCTVDGGFAGSAKVDLRNYEFKSCETWVDLTELYEIVPVTVNTHVHVAGEMVVENEVQATCTTDGGYDNVIYCTICEEEMSRTHVTVTATGHDWEFVDFTWTGSDETGYTAAVANYVCKNNADHKQSVAATVTHITTPATCETAGQTVYTATVDAAASLDEAAHSNDKTVAIPMLGHDWEFVDFTWTGSDEAGYTAAVANYKCKNDESHTKTVDATVTSQTTAATCEGAGQTVYTATVTAEASLDGKAHSDSKTVVIEATGHDWEFVDFTWTGSDEAGYTAAVANYVCKNDATHKQSVEATLTSVINPATCEGAGSTVYTATVTAEASLDKEAHNTTKTVAIPALTHDWEFVDFTWTEAENGYTAVANYKCKNDESHTNTVNATVTAAMTPATCETAGQTVYTATVDAAASLDEETHSTTKTVVIPAPGHDWKFVDFTWTEAENGFTATANYECKNDATHKQTVAATVTSQTTEATCETAGQTVYTATVAAGASLDGEAHNATKTVAIPALTHDWEFIDFTWTEAENGYTAVANYKCKNDESHTRIVAATVTSQTTAATCEGAGSTVYTATVAADASLDEETHSTTKTVVIPALGHDYTGPVWVWAADKGSAEAKFTCSRCGNIQTVQDTEIEKTQGTGEHTGYTAYTASVAFEDETYTNTVYVVNQYTLTFYANEGDTEPFAVITQDYGSAVTAPGTPVKAFYTFNSWDAEVPETMPAENRTFNAAWTAKDTYYLVGSMNEWTVSEDYEFVVNPQNSGEYSAGAALTAGDEIKVVRAIAGVVQNGDYYPSNEHIGYNGWTDNYTVDQYHAGNVTVYFRPAGNFTDLLWQNFGGYFYIEGDHLVTVDVSPSDKGTAYVTRDGSAAAAATAPNGMPLTVHYTPADNYQLDRIEILKDDGTAADVTLDGDSFNMPNHNIRVKVYFKVITWTFDEIEWTGSDEAGYTAAAKYTGDNGAVKTVDAAVTSQTTAATCEADGSTVYTAAVTAEASLDGEAKNGTKTVVIPKLGHDWEFVDFTWTAAEGGYTAVANYKCKNDAAHTNTATATVTAQITPATCEAAGSTVYTAAVTAEASPDGRAHSDTKTVAIPALNHDWKFVDFTWTEAENGYTAVANYECKNNAEHKQSVAATVTHVTTPATCEAAGQTVYTATVAAAASPDGEAKSDTKTVVIPKLGHNWEFVDFTWTEAENGYTAVANYKCKNDASHTNTAAATVTVATTPAACETAGSNVYTATVAAAASLDGKAQSDTKTVVIPATGHNWEFVDFTWTEAENGYTAVANYKCKNDASHTNTAAATVTAETTPAACETAGSTVYTAAVTAAASPDGKAHSDSKTVAIPALNHDWEFMNFTWEETADGYKAVANYKCKNDAAHKQTVAATITAATTPAACEAAGSTVYTATVAAAASLDGKAQSDTKTVVIPATGHNWAFVDFTWTGSDEDGYTAAVANYKCKTDASHTQTLKSTLTSDVTPATCEEAGQTVYTASVTAADSLDKAAHDNSKTVEVKALGHDWNEPTYVWNTDHTAVIAIFACKRNPAHMETVTVTGDKITSETTKEPTAGTPGEKTYTATITGPDGKVYTATATEEIPVLDNKEVIRIFGSDRYETSFKVADELKEQLGKDKFDQAILAYGQNFPDALAGSYLSCIFQAPILLVDSRANRIKDAQDYIKENVKAGGTIYILGETGVVPAAAVAGLDGYKVKRLGGATRYETDIEILKEAAKYNTETEILVCSGNNFPDSLSAGAAGKPILLVGAKLLDSHKEYLAGLKGNVTFTIIGGSGVVSDAVMKELSAYGSTDRVWGQDRYLTSVAVANRFFKDPESGVIAYGQNFPDGLCGGVLAYTIGGPLVLTVDNKSATAINYAEDAGMLSGAVLGGPTLVGDNTVRNIFQMEKEDKIIVK